LTLVRPLFFVETVVCGLWALTSLHFIWIEATPLPVPSFDPVAFFASSSLIFPLLCLFELRPKPPSLVPLSFPAHGVESPTARAFPASCRFESTFPPPVFFFSEQRDNRSYNFPPHLERDFSFSIASCFFSFPLLLCPAFPSFPASLDCEARADSSRRLFLSRFPRPLLWLFYAILLSSPLTPIRRAPPARFITGLTLYF